MDEKKKQVILPMEWGWWVLIPAIATVGVIGAGVDA